MRGVGAGAGTGGGGAGAKSAPEKELKKLKDEKKLEKNWSPLPVCTLHKFWLLSVTIKKINPFKEISGMFKSFLHFGHFSDVVMLCCDVDRFQ